MLEFFQFVNLFQKIACLWFLDDYTIEQDHLLLDFHLVDNYKQFKIWVYFGLIYLVFCYFVLQVLEEVVLVLLYANQNLVGVRKASFELPGDRILVFGVMELGQLLPEVLPDLPFHIVGLPPVYNYGVVAVVNIHAIQEAEISVPYVYPEVFKYLLF